MSAIAGIYHLDGQPVDCHLVERMMQAAAHRAPDGIHLWSQKAVAIGYGSLCTTPEMLREEQPLRDRTGRYCLVWDGRLDNRVEISRDLERLSCDLRDDTDAELVLHACIQWGEAGLTRLLGDFALAFWDAHERRWLCARDILGLKPLHYFFDNKTFLFASELPQILVAPFVPREPNEGMIGEVLSNEINSKTETLYKHIYRLPPAHFLTLQNGSLRIARYWEPTPNATLRYRTDAEYGEHFLELFREAVRCRLHSHLPVGIGLSGGLDSSSIAVIAHEVQGAGQANNPGMETFSMLFPGLPCDESEFIHAVTAQTGMPSNQVCGEEPDPHWYAQNTRRTAHLPDYPNGAMANSFGAQIQDKGIRVTTTGLGGDQWFEGSDWHYADHLRQGHLVTLYRLAYQDRRRRGWKSALTRQWRNGVRPLIPDSAWETARRICRRQRIPPWIKPEFAERAQILQRLRPDTPPRSLTRLTQQDIFDGSTCGPSTYCYEAVERHCALFGREERHPFMDRRLIEFALALPDEQLYRQGETKFVLRQAMRGRLPESVRLRSDKAEFSHTFVKALQALAAGPRVSLPLLTGQGWIQLEAVQQMYFDMQNSYQENGWGIHIWSLWYIFALELWLRENFT